jgi:transposase InsO family protein
MFDWLQLVKQEIYLDVQCTRINNSEENKSFHQQAQRSNYNIKFEFTAPGTPQQNGKVERAFAALYCKTRSMLNSARLTTTFRQGLWASSARLAVQL